MFETIKLEYEDHIPIYINFIQSLEKKISSLGKSEVEKKLAFHNEIVEISKFALNKIDQDALLKFLGEKHHETTDDRKK